MWASGYFNLETFIEWSSVIKSSSKELFYWESSVTLSFSKKELQEIVNNLDNKSKLIIKNTVNYY